MSTARAWDLVNYDLDNPTITPSPERPIPGHYENLQTQFGQWRKISEPYFNEIKRHWYLNVECSCGTRYKHKIYALVAGKTTQCTRCGQRESAARYLTGQVRA